MSGIARPAHLEQIRWLGPLGANVEGFPSCLRGEWQWQARDAAATPRPVVVAGDAQQGLPRAGLPSFAGRYNQELPRGQSRSFGSKPCQAPLLARRWMLDDGPPSARGISFGRGPARSPGRVGCGAVAVSRGSGKQRPVHRRHRLHRPGDARPATRPHAHFDRRPGRSSRLVGLAGRPPHDDLGHRRRKQRAGGDSGAIRSWSFAIANRSWVICASGRWPKQSREG